MTEHHEGVKFFCPQCGRKIDCHHCVEDPSAIPNYGDILICFYCKSVLEVGSGYQVKNLSLEELNQLPGYMVRNIELAIREMEKLERAEGLPS